MWAHQPEEGDDPQEGDITASIAMMIKGLFFILTLLLSFVPLPYSLKGAFQTRRKASLPSLRDGHEDLLGHRSLISFACLSS
jgi:hypothetical protein